MAARSRTQLFSHLPQPVQNLPAAPVPGDLAPLRSGRDPYGPGSAASGAKP